jgi:hypothetical protein
VKILKFWKTELSYAENKNRGKKMHLLGMDTCPSLNDVMEIRLSDCFAMYQWCEFKSCQGSTEPLSAQKSNSNTVGLNFQTYINVELYIHCIIIILFCQQSNSTILIYCTG